MSRTMTCWTALEMSRQWVMGIRFHNGQATAESLIGEHFEKKWTEDQFDSPGSVRVEAQSRPGTGRQDVIFKWAHCDYVSRHMPVVVIVLASDFITEALQNSTSSDIKSVDIRSISWITCFYN